MPEISRFFGIIVRMYYNDHQPPHFHVDYNEYSAEIQIDTLDILFGNLPKRVYSLVLEWAVEHKAELLEDWFLARENQPLNSIKELE
jgi:hypothetical protein